MKRKLDWYQQNVSLPKAEQDRMHSERQRVEVENNNQYIRDKE
jgi:hypothetical protein